MEKQEIYPKRLDPFPIRSLKKENLGNQAFEQIKQMIVRGEIPAGKRIIESELAESMGISRTPVREAVHKLGAEGFLKPLPKGGYVVRGLGISDIEETFEIRSILESFAAFLAANRHRHEEILPLEEKIEEFQRSLDNNDLKELARLNTEFHELLYALSRSQRLIKMIYNLRDEIYFLRKIILNSIDMARLSNKDHREIINAIEKRQAKTAEMLVRDHILRGKEFVINEIRKGNVSINHHSF
ncbi:MAG: GntR family transcriptional regulator [Deltaproteobacteria bacterium]|nr:GntR family transcriptional regulator [Deltaproteobacteria bacterium]MBW2106725.1 GntR family transcriptional regulator [Deltaproteobacteria bacterium]RLB18471.1 MAG: GntR family transcriptional regulator [Deltaproteobacteria bacterium]RLB20960.1 MAG: GntR family transcriptional regulator [Deltaproteobacteria bacterium]